MKRLTRIKTSLAIILATAALLPQLAFLNQDSSPSSRQTTRLFNSGEVMAYSSSTAYYNLAFKGTAHVNSHLNVNHIQDSRLLYKNWNSIYGLATSTAQLSWPQAYSTHRGQDWDTLTAKEPLYAVHAGTVTRAAYDATYGNRIEYQFGDWLLSLSHLSQMNVKKGDWVQKGQKLGNVGATGNVTGEHVHIMLYYKGKLVDPHPFLTGEWDFDAKAAQLEGTASLAAAPQSSVYTNVAGVGVRVRSGAGTNYASVGIIAPGTSVTITETYTANGYVWGKHAGGWSCLVEGSATYMRKS